MREPNLSVVDFETEAIVEGDPQPPVPVGVALKVVGRPPVYCAWGHPVNNGIWELSKSGSKSVVKRKQKVSASPREFAARMLEDVWARASNTPVLFHNSKFDQGVAWVYFGLKPLPWHDYHDTMFSLFLRDPHADTISLKPSAEAILGIPATERDAVRDWLVGEGVARADDKKWGRFISRAPGDLVGLYACGDVTRPLALHEKVFGELDEGMREAYDRERRLMPILLDNELSGMRVDVEALERDLLMYRGERERMRVWLLKRLKVSDPNFNIDSDQQLAAALEAQEEITEWTLTPTGKKSVSRKALTLDHFRDPELSYALGYYTKLGTAISQSMEPWLEQATHHEGRIFTVWNQVRSRDRGGMGGGTRSGRMSCSRFLNIVKKWDKWGDYQHPKKPRGLKELPLVRRYILPDKGEWFLHRDYSQQELRILAHFENDKMCQQYAESPMMDAHAFIQEEIKKVAGLELSREAVKIVNFRTLYGGGSGGLAEALQIPYAKAKIISHSVRAAVPGLKALEDELKNRAKHGEPLRTWGGRLYYCEPPSYSKKFGKYMTYEYKLLNYLIQGSAADDTKEVIIRYHDHPKRRGRFLVAVHDEINASGPGKTQKTAMVEMEVLRESMESVGSRGSDRWGEKKFDVPMLSEGKLGRNWADLEKEPVELLKRRLS